MNDIHAHGFPETATPSAELALTDLVWADDNPHYPANSQVLEACHIDAMPDGVSPMDGALSTSLAIPAHLQHMIDAWVTSKRSPNTRAAYRRDLEGAPSGEGAPGWIPWCLEHGGDPLTIRQAYVDAYARMLEARGASPGTVARKLSSISSWYTYLVRNEITDRNPAKWTDRPEVDRDVSAAVGLTDLEARRFLEAAEADGLRSAALMDMLLLNGLRVAVALNAISGDLGWDRGHRTIKIVLKGGRIVKAPIAPVVNHALERYHTTRPPLEPTDMVFVSDEGLPLGQPYVWRLVRSIGRRAEIPAWNDLSPHSLRHTFATLLLEDGVPLATVQDAMGHKDPRTTQRYNRARFRLDNHPTYALAAKLTPPA